MNKKSLVTLLLSIVLICFIGIIAGGEFLDWQEKKAAEKAEEEARRLEQERIQAMLGEDNLVKLDNALFIGDSRTVGIAEYGGDTGADFFCNVGMSVYNIHETKVNELSFEETLASKQYNMVYIMLGVNSLGYDFDTSVKKYGEIVEYIKEKQPDAKIFIEADLHVTKDYSEKNQHINNENINKFNEAVKKFADDKTVYYIDINTFFDDAEGNLDSEKTSDNVHIYGKHYIEWMDWIIQQTTVVLVGE